MVNQRTSSVAYTWMHLTPHCSFIAMPFSKMGIQRSMHQATVTYKTSPHFPKEKENPRLEVNAAAKSITNFWEAVCR